jgi:type I restriction enzyme S subunit
MKNSGVSWLGGIPAAWSVVRNARLFAERKETGFAGLPILEVSLRSGVRVRRFDDDARKQLMSDPDKYKRACAGDLAYNMMRMWQGAVGLAPVDGLVSPAYVVARPLPGVVAGYFAYLFRTGAYMGEVDQYSRGIVKDRNRLYWDQFKQIPSPYPPAEEQAAIVRFLDHADQRIRRYIRAKQKLIKLLEEQKQASIHSAITRGLDPNVRLKPSGVEWLGDVPEHWTLKRFKSLVRATSGQVDPRTAEHRTKILIAPNHIESGTGRVVFEETAEQQGADSGKYLVRRGQVIYSKIRPNLRKAAIASLDCLCSADMYPLTIRESELRPKFFLQLLLSVPFTRFVVDSSLRVAMPKVNRETLDAGWLWYPNLKEQDAILERAQVSAAPLDAAIGHSRREIALFLEYGTRLVADMVAGKLDVREAAETLPNEAGEPEPLDDTAAVDADNADDDADLDAAGDEDEA